MDDLMMGRVRTARPMLFQLCPSATDLPQFAQYGSTQTKVWKGPTLRYRKIQDLEQDLLYREYMALPIFQDLTSKVIGPNISIYRSMLFNKPVGSLQDDRRQGGVPIYWCGIIDLCSSSCSAHDQLNLYVRSPAHHQAPGRQPCSRQRMGSRY
jgi:hypothetical protein